LTILYFKKILFFVNSAYKHVSNVRIVEANLMVSFCWLHFNIQ